MLKGAIITPVDSLEAEVLRLQRCYVVRDRTTEVAPPFEARSALIASEHAAHLRCREEAFPELFVRSSYQKA